MPQSSNDSAAAIEAHAPIRAIVVSHLRREVEVAVLGTDDSVRVRCFQRSRALAVATGDEVLIERESEDSDRGVIVAVLPRRNVLRRRNRSGVVQDICANLDLLLVTVAPEPEPHADLIDRYLVAARADGIAPALVVNKCDLPAAGAPPFEHLVDLYLGLGLPTLRCSATTGAGINDLRAFIGSRSAALVGQSGVGKSSLINALLPYAAAEVGTLSGKRNRGHGRGRHTTSTVRLYPLGEGLIIDSPGIRELTPELEDPADLIAGFPEIATAASACRFRNCSHDREPGCAVKEALTRGAIDARRWRSFRILAAELGAGRT